MKWVKFLPLAFIAGTHGFALFAPYATLVTMIHLVTRGRHHRRRAVAITR
jgi:hypothetical protein